MSLIAALIGSVTTVFAYTLLCIGVYKIFQISTELTEIRKMLKELKREEP